MPSRIYRLNAECNHIGKMAHNEACLRVINGLNTTITMLRNNDVCYKCSPGLWQMVKPLEEEQLSVHIEYSKKIRFTSSAGNSCSLMYTFRQHGLYEWTADFNCQPIREILVPDDEYLPLVLVCGVCLMLFIFYLLWKLAKRYKITEKLYYKIRKRKEKEKDLAESEVSEATTNATTQTSRDSSVLPVPHLISDQVFRGLIMLLMILFRGEASKYWFMLPSVWNGISASDFISPWFMWTMGTIFYLHYRAELLLGTSRLALFWQVLLRSLRYMVLGFFLTSFEANLPSELRIMGTIQRYGLLHLVTFGVEVFTMKMDVKVDKLRRVKDLLDCWIQWLFMLICVAVDLLVTYLLPVPGCPTGYTGPGGLHDDSRYFSCTGGAAQYIDSSLFGDNHLLQNPSCKFVYETVKPFDPSGLLGTLNGTLTVFSGMQAARIFVYYSRVRDQISLLLIWGFVQTLLGLSLCGFSTEDGLIPLNKSLWSLSFALLTSGVGFLVFAGLYVLVDLRQYWSGCPCFEAGLNAMLLYAGREVLRYSFPFSWVPADNTTYLEFVLMDVISVIFWIVISVICYKHNRIFLI